MRIGFQSPNPLLWIRRAIALTTALLLTAVIGVALCGAQSLAPTDQKKQAPQGLWLVDFGFFSEFQGDALKKTGRPNPAFAAMIGPCCGMIDDLVFDKAGNLWIGSEPSDATTQIGELTTGQLKRINKAKTFAVDISYPPAYIDDPGPLALLDSLTFDPAGDLWVAVPIVDNLIEYTPDQLLSSGSPKAAATIHLPTVANMVRFDAAGDLWLALSYQISPFSPPSAVEFTPAQIAEMKMGGSPAPTLTIDASAGTESISALAFDPNGKLWIAVWQQSANGNGVDGGTLESFNVAGKSGTLTQPAVTITPSAISSINQSLDEPSALAFDGQGDLWVANRLSSDMVSGTENTSGFIVKFTANQLVSSGSPVPPIVIYPDRKGTGVFDVTHMVLGGTVK